MGRAKRTRTLTEVSLLSAREAAEAMNVSLSFFLQTLAPDMAVFPKGSERAWPLWYLREYQKQRMGVDERSTDARIRRILERVG